MSTGKSIGLRDTMLECAFIDVENLESGITNKVRDNKDDFHYVKIGPHTLSTRSVKKSYVFT